MQKINILGVGLTDYSLKESVVLLEDYIKSGGLHTILYITPPVLILAGQDEEEKKYIETADLALCGDSDLLRDAGIDSQGRAYEVENRVFLKEFLRRIVRNSGKIYLLGESEEEVNALREELGLFQKGLIFNGSCVIAQETEDTGEIINKINDVAPMAIVSRLSPGRQEKYMAEFKPFVNAKVWLGISKDMVLGADKEPIRNRIMGKIYKRIFRSRMNRFKDKNGE